MNLEQALNIWLSEFTGLDCYWLKRPEQADNAVVYRCISPGFVDVGGMRKTGIRQDAYSITIYHQDADEGKRIASEVTAALDHFNGTIAVDTQNTYHIQLSTFSGGFDQWIETDGSASLYQFNRDFVINH